MAEGISSKRPAPLCVDVPSVLEYGLERWLEDFSWPVSLTTSQQMFSSLVLLFTDEISKMKKEDRFSADLLTISYKLAFDYCNTLYCLKIMEEVRRQGKTLRYSQISTHYRGLAEQGRPIRSGNDVIYEHYFDGSTLQRGKRIMKNLAKSIYYCRGWPRSRSIAFQMNPLCREHIRQRTEWISFLEAADLFRDDLGPPPSFAQDAVRNLTRCILRGVEEVSRRFSIPLERTHLDYFEEITQRQLTTAAGDYLSVKRELEKRHLVHLYTGTVGGYYRRLMSSVVQSLGGSVTSFEHGGFTWHGYGYKGVLPFYHFNVLATINRHGLYHKNSLLLLEKSLRENPRLLDKKVELFSVNSREGLEDWKIERRKKPPNRIKTVMVVGSIMRAETLYIDHPPHMIRVDLEMRILRVLREAGWDVIYKHHPDSPLEARELQGICAGIILAEPFEEVMEMADAYLFCHSASSPFVPALLSNKPVIYLQADDRDWGNDYSLLAKRCRMVSCRVDERNRILFSKDELLAALAQPPEESHEGFIQKYYLPETN